jgi:hypothetical protein
MRDDIGESHPEACVGAGANPGLCTELLPESTPVFLASGSQMMSPFSAVGLNPIMVMRSYAGRREGKTEKDDTSVYPDSTKKEMATLMPWSGNLVAVSIKNGECSELTPSSNPR